MRIYVQNPSNNHVMKVFVKTVNFIKSRGLNQHQFQEFLKSLESGNETYFILHSKNIASLSKNVDKSV